MNIIPLVVGPLSTNCYLIADTQDSCIIIDPGEDADLITDTILQRKLSPKAIILTHGHFDHVGACLELVLNFQLPIALHPDDLFLLPRSSGSSKFFTNEAGLKVPKPSIMLNTPHIGIPGFEEIQIIHVPGHTPGSICLYFNGKLLTGDTLFAEGIGRTDFSYSNAKLLSSSVMTLSKLPPDTQIYPGHEQYGVLLSQALSFIK